MGGYDSKRFSSLFAERTMTNYDYINNYTKKFDKEQQLYQQALESYSNLFKETKTMSAEISEAANHMANSPNRERRELKRKFYAAAAKLSDISLRLEPKLNEIKCPQRTDEDEPFEVTQLLNSLMGVAVLPYEMHKELFKSFWNSSHMKPTEIDSCNNLKNSIQYDKLYRYIMQLYNAGKWKSNYSRDKKQGQIDEEIIVFRFLYHVRNAVCHSGDNAMSILPLNEGEIIEHIAFYDRDRHDESQEFAMYLEVKELEKLIRLISDFYSNSQVGWIDKTQCIIVAEKRVKKLLQLK